MEGILMKLAVKVITQEHTNTEQTNRHLFSGIAIVVKREIDN